MARQRQDSESAPRWSPDGRYLSFTSSRPGPAKGNQVWLLDRNGVLPNNFVVTLPKAGDPSGMSLPVLRETRMPAVLCELGPPAVVVGRGAELACAFSRALERWVHTLDEV